MLFRPWSLFLMCWLVVAVHVGAAEESEMRVGEPMVWSREEFAREVRLIRPPAKPTEDGEIGAETLGS